METSGPLGERVLRETHADTTAGHRRIEKTYDEYHATTIGSESGMMSRPTFGIVQVSPAFLNYGRNLRPVKNLRREEEGHPVFV